MCFFLLQLAKFLCLSKSYLLLFWPLQEQTHKSEKENQVHNTGQYGWTGENGITAKIQYVTKFGGGYFVSNIEIVFNYGLFFFSSDIKHRSTEHNSSLMMSESEIDSEQDTIFSYERTDRARNRSNGAMMNGDTYSLRPVEGWDFSLKRTALHRATLESLQVTETCWMLSLLWRFWRAQTFECVNSLCHYAKHLICLIYFA